MSFHCSSQFTRRRPSSQSARLPSASVPTSDHSVSSAQSLSLTPSASCVPSVSLVPSDLSSINPTILVNRNAVEPICRVSGTASLYLPIKRTLTLPGHRTFTQHPHVPSKQQTRTGSTPADDLSTGPHPNLEDGPSPWSKFHDSNLLTDGLQVSQDPFSLPSRNS